MPFIKLKIACRKFSKIFRKRYGLSAADHPQYGRWTGAAPGYEMPDDHKPDKTFRRPLRERIRRHPRTAIYGRTPSPTGMSPCPSSARISDTIRRTPRKFNRLPGFRTGRQGRNPYGKNGNGKRTPFQEPRRIGRRGRFFRKTALSLGKREIYDCKSIKKI